jgi:beta-galactosidase
MIREGVAERLAGFVAQGGTLCVTYWSGIVDQNDLCFSGGFPGPLRKLLGICVEEIDALYPQDRNSLIMAPDNELGLTGEYELKDFCEIVQAESAKVLARYKHDFYKDGPVLTVNSLGRGQAYYLAARVEERFLEDFYASLVDALSLKRALAAEFPEGVTAQVRSDGSNDYIFLLNFTQVPQRIDLGNHDFREMLTDRSITGQIDLEPYAVKVIV